MEQGQSGQHGHNAAWQEQVFMREAGWGVRLRGDKKRKGEQV